MTNGFELIKESIPNQEAATEMLGRLHDAARPQAVFSEVVQHGDYAVITASEVSVGLGYGYGSGGGSGPANGVELPSSAQGNASNEEATAGPAMGYGSGGGGGGGAMGRPVAVIEIGPNGVRVEPIVDPTKIALALFTALGAMFMTLNKMRRQAGG